MTPDFFVTASVLLSLFGADLNEASFQKTVAIISTVFSTALFLFTVVYVAKKAKNFLGTIETPSADVVAARQAELLKQLNTLTLRLLAILVDYLLKLIDFAKNLFYFPIGVDHREFKHEYYVYDYVKTPPERKKQPNTGWIAFKPSYVIICLLCYLIPIIVYGNVKTALAMFSHNPVRANSIALLIGIAIFFSDVAIVRTSIKLGSLNYLSQQNWLEILTRLLQKCSAYMLRSLVVVCTSLTLGFALVPDFYRTDLDQALQRREKQKLLDSKEFENFQALRHQLIQTRYNLSIKKFCAGFAFTGGSKDAVYLGDSKEEIDKTLPSFSKETTAPQSQVTPADVCAPYLRIDEPVCEAALPLKQTPCKNAYKLAREVLNEANSLYGEEIAKTQYDLGGFRDLKTVGIAGITAQDSASGKFQSTAAALTDRFQAVSSLSIIPNASASTRNPQLPLMERLRQVAVGVFYPIANGISGNSGIILDPNEAAFVAAAKFSKFSENPGLSLPLAILAILAVFELLVILLKGMGTFDVLEYRAAKLKEEYQNFIDSGGVRVGMLIQSQMLLKTDWGIQDHLFELLTQAKAIAASMVTSRVRAILITTVLFLVVVYLIAKVIFGGLLFSLFNAIFG